MCAGYLFRILSSIYEYCAEKYKNREEQEECIKKKFRELVSSEE